MDGTDIARAIALICVLALVFPSFGRMLEERAPVLRHAIYWLAFGAVLWIGYDLVIAP